MVQIGSKQSNVRPSPPGAVGGKGPTSVKIVIILSLSVLIMFVLWSTPPIIEVATTTTTTTTSARHANHDEEIGTQLIRRTFAALNDDDIKSIIKPFTMTGPRHIDLALTAINRININNIEGAVVECGVWKGGVSMGMMMVNLRHNIDRDFYLFDTFEGLPEPTDEKNGWQAQHTYRDVQAKLKGSNLTGLKFGEQIDWMLRDRHIEDGKWNYGAYDVVRNNMYFAGYPHAKIHLVKGKVEDTLSVPANLPDKIAILRLDTDWYESTKIEMDVLFERLVPGGLLAVDDFCTWQGSKIAVEEYFSSRLGKNITDEHNNKAKEFQPLPCLHYWKPTT